MKQKLLFAALLLLLRFPMVKGMCEWEEEEYLDCAESELTSLEQNKCDKCVAAGIPRARASCVDAERRFCHALDACLVHCNSCAYTVEALLDCYLDFYSPGCQIECAPGGYGASVSKRHLQEPPPEVTPYPPPEDTDEPPPEDTDEPPPDDTDEPPPEDTDDPPPKDTETPPPDDMTSPPDDDIPPPGDDTLPPDDATPPPELEETPPPTPEETSPPDAPPEVGNPCDPNPCVNGQCTVENANVYCECDPGWTLDALGACTIVDETNTTLCDPNPCVHGQCDDDGATWWCTCDTGWFVDAGGACTRNLCDPPNPCVNGECHEDGFTWSCDCYNHWAKDDLGACTVVSTLCDPDPCVNGLCYDNGDMWWCNCDIGWVEDADGKCTLIAQTPCSSNPCGVHAQCSYDETYIYCDCDPGWTEDAGGFCTVSVTTPCDPSPCGEHGQCVDQGNSTYDCLCDSGYFGEPCQPDDRTEECQPPCSEHFLCVDLGAGTYDCVCDPNYNGEACQQEKDPCDADPCGEHGDCYDQGDGKHDCLCDSGFCGEPCQPDDRTEDSPCQHFPCGNGTCYANGNDFICDCCPGWNGMLCSSKIEDDEVEKVDSCEPDPCVWGNCTLSNDTHSCASEIYTPENATFKCICDPGWVGTRCNISSDEWRAECTISPCDLSPCRNGKCYANGNDFICDCYPGWSGTLCLIEIDDDEVEKADSCVPDPCVWGNCSLSDETCVSGNCTPSNVTFLCSCDPGFTGTRCNFTEDVWQSNSCDPSPCLHGDCTLGEHSFLCSCNPGWAGTRCSIPADRIGESAGERASLLVPMAIMMLASRA